MSGLGTPDYPVPDLRAFMDYSATQDDSLASINIQGSFADYDPGGGKKQGFWTVGVWASWK